MPRSKTVGELMRMDWQTPATRWRAALTLTAGLILTLTATGCTPSAGQPDTLSALPTQVGQIIAITTDRPHYGPSEVIGVTVRNITTSPFYATEQYSGCTMLQLQLHLKGAWQTVQPCVSGPPPQVRQLAPKGAFPLSFGPGNAPDDPNLWRVGTYRFALAYSTKSDGSNATAFSYSAGFDVTP
jgi:hypothetical protein